MEESKENLDNEIIVRIKNIAKVQKDRWNEQFSKFCYQIYPHKMTAKRR